MSLEASGSVVRRTVQAAIAAIIFVLSLLPLPAIAAPVALTSLLASPVSPVEGSWRTQNGTEVTIAPCGSGFCGTLSWIVIPKAVAAACRAEAKPSFAAKMVDINNKDKTLQSRPLLGLEMLELTPTSDPTSFNVKVYNAEDGSTNNAQVFIMNSSNTLRIGGGCIGTMCVQSQDWPRVPTRDNTPDFTCEGGQ